MKTYVLSYSGSGSISCSLSTEDGCLLSSANIEESQEAVLSTNPFYYKALDETREMFKKGSDTYKNIRQKFLAEIKKFLMYIPDEVIMKLKKTSGDCEKRIVVLIPDECKQVEHVPFEWFFCSDFADIPGVVSIVRSSGLWNPAVPTKKNSLNVLFFSALPENLSGQEQRIDIEKIEQQIYTGLQSLAMNGKVNIESEDLFGTLEELKKRLESCEVDLLVIACHGCLQNGKAMLVFEDQEGNKSYVSAGGLREVLKGVLKGKRIRFGIILACHSYLVAAELKEFFDYIIGMESEVVESGVEKLVQFLTETINSGGSFEDLLRRYRDHFNLQDGIDFLDLAAPRLYSQYQPVPLVQFPEQLEATHYEPGMCFVGRRKQRRFLYRAFDAWKRWRCLVICAEAGMGKSALAVKFAEMIAKRKGYRVVEVTGGNITSESLAAAISENPFTGQQFDFAELLRKEDEQCPFVLILHDFEDNFVGDKGVEIKHDSEKSVVRKDARERVVPNAPMTLHYDALEAVHAIASLCKKSFLIVTTRYDVDLQEQVDSRLRDVFASDRVLYLPPLSMADTYKMLQRLRSYRNIKPEKQGEIACDFLGSHPRSIEMLNSLLDGGGDISQINEHIKMVSKLNAQDALVRCKVNFDC